MGHGAGELDRRKFLEMLGKATLLGSAAAALPGCSRLLEQSQTRRGGARREMRRTAPTPAESGKRPANAAHPDLSVAKGSGPEAITRKAIDGLGGITRFVTKGARVVIKPNLLTGQPPEYAVTTNPVVVGTLIKMCFEAGARDVTVLDRPTSEPRQTFEISGIAQATQAAGGRVKYLTDRNYDNVRIPKGRLLTSWPLVTDVFDADLFINVPIAKTHDLAILTMAMKNLMGIMGGDRGMMHVDFDQKIVDLNTVVKPHLVVLDAYRILVRGGPTGGSLSDVKLAKMVVAGTNQASVDAYGATLFGMKPSDLPYLVKAKEQGVGETDLGALRIAKSSA